MELYLRSLCRPVLSWNTQGQQFAFVAREMSFCVRPWQIMTLFTVGLIDISAVSEKNCLTRGRHKRTGRCCHWKTAQCRCTRKHCVLRTTRGPCLPSRIVAHVVRLGGSCEVQIWGTG